VYYGAFHQPGSPLHRVNPSAKLLLAASVMLAVTLVFDPVTPALLVALALGLLLVVGRIPASTLARALVPAAIAAVGFLWVAVVFPRAYDHTTAIAQWGPLVVTDQALWRGGAISVRVFCFAVYSLLFVLTTDPTDFVVALVKHWRVPPRIAYASLAAFRFVPLFTAEAESIRLAHRVRGLGEGRGLIGRWEAWRRFAIPLLASAIRRAERVAIAMESKGFDGTSPRTHFRVVRWQPIDLYFLVAMTAAVMLVFGLSYRLGTLQFWDGTTF
jgi:energy-coupling factor transport system permease protein